MTEVNALAQVYGNVSILVPADWRFTPGRRLKVEGSIHSSGVTKSRKSAPPRDPETGSSNLWVFPCFRSKTFGTITFHQDVSNIRFDSELFIRFRELYFRNRSWIQRFLEMKEVKEIAVINVSSRVENLFPEAH